jgi:hypothetical protein
MRNPICRGGQYCVFVHSLQNLSFYAFYVYLVKISINELTNDAAIKHDVAIITNLNVLFIEHYCV